MRKSDQQCRIREAIDVAKRYQPDAFLAVGGGSVIDTAKLMNLYTTFPGEERRSSRRLGYEALTTVHVL